MKKLLSLLLLLVVVTTAKAQFEQDTYYVNTSLTSFDLSYSGSEKTHFGVQGIGGYFIEDDLAIMGNVGVDIRNNSFNEFTIGAGGRYYFEQNGIYLGAGAMFVHGSPAGAHSYNDVMPYGEVGYAFFVNKHITIEPSLYYRQSFKDHSNYSKVGVKVGLGFYF